MRLWSLHPEHLDPKGLVALWREALLAQAVLAGETCGYTNHPQLDRFRAHANPLACIAMYLREIAHHELLTAQEEVSLAQRLEGGKAALRELATADETLDSDLRMELEHQGVQVSIVVPGLLQTRIHEKSAEASRRDGLAGDAESQRIYGRAMAAAAEARIPGETP